VQIEAKAVASTIALRPNVRLRGYWHCDTYTHMKTTVEIPDAILEEARKVAARQRTTLRVLIVEGLRRVVAERKHPGTFRLRKASFRGQGLQPDVRDASWERLREMAYQDRGG
jgi:hypothetical protein